MMVVGQRATDPFDIHEDARTEETEMMVEDVHDAATADPRAQHKTPEVEEEELLDEEEAEEAEEEQENNDDDDASSEDEPVDRGVQADMDKLQSDFPGFADKYRLLKRIGEGSSQAQGHIAEEHSAT